MQTQTQTQTTSQTQPVEGFSDVFEKLLAEQQIAKPAKPAKQPQDEKARRYVWFIAEDQPWPEIYGGFIERGRVTPILPFKLWERIADVPEHMRIDFRQSTNSGPEPFEEAAYELLPGWIFDSLITQYELRGVRELRALYDWPLLDVVKLNLDQLFVPWKKSVARQVDEIPRPYRIVREHIETVLNDNKDKMIRKVGEDMLLSIAASEAYDNAFLDEEEGRPNFRYSKPGFRALSRLERRPKDKAIEDMAAVQNAVFSKLPDILMAQSGESPALIALIGQMKEQGERQQQQIELLTQILADRPSKKKD